MAKVTRGTCGPVSQLARCCLEIFTQQWPRANRDAKLSWPCYNAALHANNPSRVHRSTTSCSRGSQGLEMFAASGVGDQTFPLKECRLQTPLWPIWSALLHETVPVAWPVFTLPRNFTQRGDNDDHNAADLHSAVMAGQETCVVARVRLKRQAGICCC